MTSTDTTADVTSGGVRPDELVAAYLAAWNSHDGPAVAELVAGSYVDPTLAAPVQGAAIATMVDSLCAAFPDLTFEQVSLAVDGDRAVAEWRMRGTNDGAALPGAPAPTGATLDLPGIDVFTVGDGRIADVVGYFDQKSFVDQLGLQSFVMPQDSWPVSFGTATRVDLGHRARPGAMTMTWVDVRDDDEVAELTSRSEQVVRALVTEPGFLGFQAMTVGRHNTTLAYWTSPEAAEAALARAAPHRDAQDRVTREGFSAGGWTGFWQPYRLNEQFVRCSCGTLVQFAGDATEATCGCGTVHESRPYF